MTGVTAELTAELDRQLQQADAELAARYPGERVDRQPVHTVYVPADRFGAGTVREWGTEALRLLDTFAPDAPTLAAATGFDPGEVSEAYDAVRGKLQVEPVEDLRVDLEDGYGLRPDDVEDAHLRGTVEAFRRMADDGTRPPWFGVRFKSFEAPTRARGAHADPGRRRVRRRRRAARRLHPDPAQGHVRRPGRGDGDGVRAAGAGVQARGRRHHVRDPGRDRAVDHGR